MNVTQTKIPKKVDRQLQYLDSELIELLKLLKDYSERTLNKKPAEG